VSGGHLSMTIDESDICGYINILVGTVETPKKPYMLDCISIACTIYNEVMCHNIDIMIRFLEIYVLLLMDAAKYMVSAGQVLKTMYTQLFHVTCVAHLLHNCAMKVKTKYAAVDNLIATVKALTVKNRERRDLFRIIGQPPQPVVTRWTTWLHAAFYYAEHMPTVGQIVNSIEGKWLLLAHDKEAVASSTLVKDLINILQYKSLAHLVELCEFPNYQIRQAVEDLKNISVGADSCTIIKYFDKRLDNTDIMDIMKMERNDVSPHLYALLQESQPTSAAVERSFFMLKKILRDNRNFDVENVQYYALLNFNSAA